MHLEGSGAAGNPLQGSRGHSASPKYRLIISCCPSLLPVSDGEAKLSFFHSAKTSFHIIMLLLVEVFRINAGRIEPETTTNDVCTTPAPLDKLALRTRELV